MDKRIVILTIVILLVIVVVLFGVYIRMKYTSKEGIRIIVYRQGRETKLNTESNYFTELIKKSENIFVNADDALLLTVTKQTIDKVKETTAVEIIYSKPKEFNIQVEKYYIRKVDALLISFNDKNAVIYYSINGSYSSGPFVNKKEEDVKEVRDLFKNIGG